MRNFFVETSAENIKTTIRVNETGGKRQRAVGDCQKTLLNFSYHQIKMR
jgi:hypothetical protein